MDLKSVKVFGVKITDISRDEWCNYLYDFFYHKKSARIVILTEKRFFQALFNKQLCQTINQANVVLCSSSLVAWLCGKIHSLLLVPNLPATYIIDTLGVASECQSTVSFFGSNKKNLATMVNKLTKSFQGIRVVAAYPNKIHLKDQSNVYIALRKTKATLALFNLGSSKKQELWINDHFALSRNGVVIGTDDSFEVLAGKKSAPPLSFQQRGWLGQYALLRNPFNIAKYFRIFVILCFYVFRKDKKN